MRINELFTNGAVPWQWTEKESDSFIAGFVVDKERYDFSALLVNDEYAVRDDPNYVEPNEWEIAFRALDHRYWHGITGSGNAAVVMATVVDIMREFLKTHPNIDAIQFSAAEQSRRSLYTRMIRRLLPTWKLTTSGNGRYFKATSPTSTNESTPTKMRINELFTTGAVPWQWTSTGGPSLDAKFRIGKEKYEFYAILRKSQEFPGTLTCAFAFEAVQGGFGITGTGNAAAVMATVVDILRDILKTNPNINRLRFSAHETSRRSLYSRMIKRLLPTWEQSLEKDGQTFIVTQPVTTNEGQMNELFTTGAVPWQWKHDELDHLIAKFVVKGQMYQFQAWTDDLEEWAIMFRSQNTEYDGTDGYDITGTGNAAIVMATVVAITRALLIMRPTLTSLKFSAEETSRQSLYAKMVQRLVPTWKLSLSNQDKFFTITKPAQPTESRHAGVKINELFTNGAVPWQWSKKENTSDNKFAYFEVEGEAYKFSSYFLNKDLYIDFSAYTRANRFGITGTGNAAVVMATVVNILMDLLNQRDDVNSISFSAASTSRQSLYTKMIKRILPSWILTKSPSGGDFTVARPDNVDTN